MDGGTVSTGVVFLISGAVSFFWPHSRHFGSSEHRQRRLRELDAGASEDFFEERRALEAYPPKVHVSQRTIALSGAAMMVAGACLIGLGLFD